MASMNFVYYFILYFSFRANNGIILEMNDLLIFTSEMLQNANVLS
jgi:hypothetical protein